MNAFFTDTVEVVDQDVIHEDIIGQAAQNATSIIHNYEKWDFVSVKYKNGVSTPSIM